MLNLASVIQKILARSLVFFSTLIMNTPGGLVNSLSPHRPPVRISVMSRALLCARAGLSYAHLVTDPQINEAINVSLIFNIIHDYSLI